MSKAKTSENHAPSRNYRWIIAISVVLLIVLLVSGYMWSSVVLEMRRVGEFSSGSRLATICEAAIMQTDWCSDCNGVLRVPDTQTQEAVLAAGAYEGFESHIHPNFAALILYDANTDGGWISPDVCISPLGSVGDGKGDYWLNFGARIDQGRADVMLGYERSSYVYEEKILVLFEDMHLAEVSRAEFAQIVEALGPDVDVMLPERK